MATTPAPDLALPPGLVYDGEYVVTSAGSTAGDAWAPYDSVKGYTNAFIRQDGKILLGYKKRGFGMGLYNGFGGKVDAGETPIVAAVRELQEEAGITAPLKPCGTLFFVTSDSTQAFHIDIFTAHEYTGTIAESDEMRPEWFASPLPAELTGDDPAAAEASGATALPPVPFEQMWADDEFWMPLLLARRRFIGRADFGPGNELRRWWFATVGMLE